MTCERNFDHAGTEEIPRVWWMAAWKDILARPEGYFKPSEDI
jgi:hypothetical protein